MQLATLPDANAIIAALEASAKLAPEDQEEVEDWMDIEDVEV